MINRQLASLIIAGLLMSSIPSHSVGVVVSGSLPVETPVGTVSIGASKWFSLPNVPQPWGRYALYTVGGLITIALLYSVYKANTAKKAKNKKCHLPEIKISLPHWKVHYEL